MVVDLGVCGIETELVTLEEFCPKVMHLRPPRWTISGTHTNLNDYQTEIRFAMVFSVATIVETILHLKAVNNSD
jgi:hypothetical protein